MEFIKQNGEKFIVTILHNKKELEANCLSLEDAKIKFEELKQFIEENLINMSLYKLFGRNTVSQRKISAYEKAKKHDFYLNLDCQYDIDMWISLISKTSSI